MGAACVARRQAAAMPGDDKANDNDFTYDDDTIVPFWYTSTGHIVRWVIFLCILVLFLAYVLGGYIHAKKRMRKGLPPLAYHRWLVPRHELARVDPRYALPPQHPMYAAAAANNTNYHYRPGYQNQYDPSYNMQSNMPPPPPMYDPNAPRPPMYEAPQGGTKMAPNQEYEAPPGPPPPPAVAATGTAEAAAQPVRRDDTGSTNPFRA
ncbi:hypothetical protein SLS53_003604 [Cytospora paraplurivora]|uniref:Uncharacterized protein n=1 Tax=Cytospora paraplurivora TaxID=2898453 RepID=A0AAN9UA31_9PEZI